MGVVGLFHELVRPRGEGAQNFLFKITLGLFEGV
jgi:hypothetical protein